MNLKCYLCPDRALFNANSQLSTINFYHYDGNGNVTELTDASGTTVASYRYTAFGQLRSSSGPAAEKNTYRFSTKPFDDVAACYYYGYRFYNPEMGRWLNRDPIAERGGVNLLVFVTNSPIDNWDYLGLQKPRTGNGNNPNNLPLQFNIGTSLNVGGCFNAGPFIICVTGGYSISKGKCCDSSTGEEKDVVELSGSISASTGLGISTGFTYSFDPIGQLGMVGGCPSGSIDSIWDAISGSFDVDAQLGPLAGSCSWSGPSSGWSCSAGIDFSLGASVTVGGTLKVSGQFLD